MDKVEFTACEHLDFEPNYGGCRRQMLAGGKLFWVRPDYGTDNPQMVQFCKKRGRLNNPKACLDEAHSACSDYAEFDHVIKIEKEEIES